MRFYTQAHRYYCGIDLHARWMYLCILDPQGEVLLHRNLRACPEVFLKAVEPYRQDLVVAVECIFSWYWLADLCAQEVASRQPQFARAARSVVTETCAQRSL